MTPFFALNLKRNKFCLKKIAADIRVESKNFKFRVGKASIRVCGKFFGDS